MMEIQYGEYTFIGMSRKQNEDSILAVKVSTEFGEILLAGVFDGMGGMDDGAYASQYAKKIVEEWFNYSFLSRLNSGFTFEQIKNEWISLFENINSELVDYGEERNKHCGTTATLGLFFYDKYIVFHIGDSRLYEISEEVSQITSDQTLAEREVESGLITREQAKESKNRHVLLTCLGVKESMDYVIQNRETVKEGYYFFASDGFYDRLDHDDLLDLCKGAYGSIEEGLSHYAQAVMDRGETDNISGVLIHLNNA